MQDFFTTYPKANTTWSEIATNYTWSYGVPKETLDIKLAENTTDTRRQYIINGLRPLLKSEKIIIVDKVALLDSI